MNIDMNSILFFKKKNKISKKIQIYILFLILAFIKVNQKVDILWKQHQN